MTAPQAEAPAPRGYCGTCADRYWVWCQECVGGCEDCNGQGTVSCPQCRRPGQPPLDPERWWY